eukprot:CAMPEP_0204574268 /NCGR_PEP_ID=MMETSP0661-20131031/40503_1 /ASSEMBLY_ACC=CAM_ASM_000606 /TAXON_ID=109239 /ORGANISM="Alexandrium margalefi, Strain AMGDE01CS-322" /LENGTH=82 /DNA_ID=CAMNT_0051582775 /DNA_START=42 /DNA_END=287 /DNA_ORIENTATION=-
MNDLSLQNLCIAKGSTPPAASQGKRQVARAQKRKSAPAPAPTRDRGLGTCTRAERDLCGRGVVERELKAVEDGLHQAPLESG